MGVPVGLQELLKAGFEDFVIPVYEDAPFTTIQNRAKVTRSLKAVAGVERVHVKSINPVSNEFGLNGEMVWEADNKDSRFRVVGNPVQFSNSSGSGFTTNTSDTSTYVEFTFYGTGLNWLGYPATGALDYRASVDGGVEGSNFMTPQSTALVGRNYSPNIILNVVSGLTLDWHTVKVRKNDTVSSMILYGFEILNETSDLAVYAGQGISNGNLFGMSSQQSSAWNVGVSGVKGARVVKYVDGGQLKTAVTEVDATAKYLTNTDHTNEEVVRRINFREFGANRSDDPSTLAPASASTRSFTLDDGTTSLLVQTGNADLFNGIDGVYPSVGSDFLQITFVGTGLDIYTASSAYAGNGTLSVDGVAQGSIVLPYGTVGRGLVKLCSGLPYGTHTVRVNRTSVGTFFLISDFIVYQPKKPVFSGFEVADYNLMATYVNPTVTTAASVPAGVLRKMNIREMVFSGTWAVGAVGITLPSGFTTTTTTAASYVEYRFWGTGFSYRFGNNSGAQSNTISVDGSTNLSAFTTALTATAGLSFTAATGVITGSPAGSIGENNLSVTGLTLGWHTVRVTWSSGAVLSPACFDVITPIHMNEPSLKIGNQSLRSVNKYSPEKAVSNAGPDLSVAKAWVFYDGVNQQIIRSFNVRAVVRQATGVYRVFFEKQFKDGNYVVTGSGMGSRFVSGNTLGANRNPGSAIIGHQNDAGTAVDDLPVNAIFYGELIDE